jgi:cysteinyl-tRNA synthetase
MGKSLNNFITIKDAVKKYDPMAIRFFILMSHYRSTLDFSEKALHGATSGLMKIRTFVSRIDQAVKLAAEELKTDLLTVNEYEKAFCQAMNDDFNTPQALATLFDYINKVNKILDTDKKPAKSELRCLRDTMTNTVCKVLGIRFGDEQEQKTSTADLDTVMQVLLEIRGALRQEKNFALADKIRETLQKRNILIQDTPDGPTWIKN